MAGSDIFWSSRTKLELESVTEIGDCKSNVDSYAEFVIPTLCKNWDIPLNDLFWLTRLLIQEKPIRIAEFGTFTRLATL